MGKKLTEYRRKRDFGKTPEPVPGRPEGRGDRPIFVVHRHEATRLHYDLRLEMGGVLRSFAVPKGFSYVPADKHLAVRTEDHPLSYETFEGVIPKGEYGAGTMTIWDRGALEVLKSEEGPKGKLEIVLRGRRLRGEWHLVKTSRGEKEWLLFKARDTYARSPEERGFPFDVDLGGARRGEPSRRPTPMRPHGEVAPFSDPGWVFELEFEGIRVFARKEGERVRLVRASTGRLLEGDPGTGLVTSLAGVHAESAVLDGVLVATDEGERPSRAALERRLAGEGDASVRLYAFDLLHYDEWRVKSLPLVDRKRLLAALLPKASDLLFVDHVLGEGERLARTVAEAGLPGVIAKDAGSAYRGGSSKSWRRVSIGARVHGSPGLLSDALAPAGSEGSGRVAYSNREKLYWPERGFTKGDMLAYYERAAEHLLPHLHERPLHLQRFPDGIGGKSFYEKNAPEHLPDWVETEPIPTGDKVIRYIVCNDRETLLLLANLGSIDLHPWMSRRGSLDSPDWLVLDLDPKSAPFGDVMRVARAVGKLLRGIGLRPYLKTSGASGLHVTVPLVPGYTYDQSVMFAEMVARAIVRDHPDLCTVERSVARRRGKVYVDYLQNRRGQTIVPPWVPRPVPAGSVSTPLHWDELSGDLDPARFDLETAPLRMAQTGDLFRGVLTDGQDLAPAIEAFREHYA